MIATSTDSRFGRLTFPEALIEAETRETWLVEGLVSASSTLIYGEAKVGKSFLVSALVAALESGEEFLGRPVPIDRDFNVAVCWTDDGGAADYSSQISGVLPDGLEPNVSMYMLPVMTPDKWAELFDELMLHGHNIVVIDNMTQCLDGSINDDSVVRRFFDGVRLFTRANIPVIIVGHSTDKAGMNGAKNDKPLGSSAISQSVRWRGFVKRSRRGNLTLRFSGNYAEPHEVTVKHGAGARFEVLDTMSAEQLYTASEARTAQRSAGTYARNREMAQHVVDHCQGLTLRRAADVLAAKFGGEAGTLRNRLSAKGAIGQMLTRDGSGDATRWSLPD